MRQISMLIKPVSQKCNMDCSYCFYHDIANKRQCKDYGIMKQTTMKNLIDKVFALQTIEVVNFGFQGGEPTLAGIEFFQDFIDYVEQKNKKGIKINYSLQTNGTLLTPEFYQLFKEKQFLIGLSLDGPREINDKNRYYNNGDGTYTDIIKSLNELKKNKIKFNVLVVVTKQLAENPKKIYRFFQKKEVKYLQFIPCIEPFGKIRGKNSYSLSAEDYGVFLDRLFNLWFKDYQKGIGPEIRQFQNWQMLIRGYVPQSCEMRGVCSIQNVIEADGSVYPCDFYVFENLKLGNINNEDFVTIYQNSLVKTFIDQSKILPDKCHKCQYKLLCRGGCYRQRNPQTNINNYCESYRYFFKHNEAKLRSLK